MEDEHQDGEYSSLPNSHNGIDNGNNNEGPIQDDRSWEDIPGPSYLNHFNDDIPSSSSSSSNYETPSKRAKTIESSESSKYDTSSSYESSSSNDQGPYWKRKLAPRRKRLTKTAKLRKSITLREKKRREKLAIIKNKKQRAEARRKSKQHEKELRHKIKEQMKQEIERYLADLDDKIDFEYRGSTEYRQWGTTQYNFNMRFIQERLQHIRSYSQIMDITTELFIRGIERALQESDINDTDQVRIILRNPTLDRYTSISFRQLSELDIERDILSKFEQIIQSNESIVFVDEIEINIVVARKPRQKGGRYLHRTIMSLQRWLKKKTSIVVIKNTEDNMCFARALAVTKGYIEYKNGDMSRLVFDKLTKDRPEQY